MSMYQSIKLVFKNPKSGKEFTVFGFGLSGFSGPDFNKLLEEEPELGNAISAMEITQPIDLRDLSAYEGFSEFVEALSAEE